MNTKPHIVVLFLVFIVLFGAGIIYFLNIKNTNFDNNNTKIVPVSEINTDSSYKENKEKFAINKKINWNLRNTDLFQESITFNPLIDKSKILNSIPNNKYLNLNTINIVFSNQKQFFSFSKGQNTNWYSFTYSGTSTQSNFDIIIQIDVNQSTNLEHDINIALYQSLFALNFNEDKFDANQFLQQAQAFSENTINRYGYALLVN